jgi:hypothetical protein
MKTEIYKTYSDFLNREDKRVNGVSPETAMKDIVRCAEEEKALSI